MTPTHDDALGLLERSLGYTRGRLGVVATHHLARATPCADWDLRELLAHLEDALDAFTEAASGLVAAPPPPPLSLSSSAPAPPRVDRLQDKACGLLAAWLTMPAAVREPVVVGDVVLEAPLVVAAAALEITLHGWDVGRATGELADVPESLAADLVEIARRVVDRRDRFPQFGPVRPVAAGATASHRLLAWTGRGTEPPPSIRRVPPSRGGLAS